MKYGEAIKELRTRAGLTQIELAEKTGITQAAISYYESNEKIPNVKTADKIAGALGVTLNDIMNMVEG